MHCANEAGIHSHFHFRFHPVLRTPRASFVTTSLFVAVSLSLLPSPCKPSRVYIAALESNPTKLSPLSLSTTLSPTTSIGSALRSTQDNPRNNMPADVNDSSGPDLPPEILQMVFRNLGFFDRRFATQSPSQQV